MKRSSLTRFLFLGFLFLGVSLLILILAQPPFLQHFMSSFAQRRMPDNPERAFFHLQRILRMGLYSSLVASGLLWTHRHSPNLSKTVLLFSLLAGSLFRIDFWVCNTLWTDTYALKAGIMTHSFSHLITTGPGFRQSAPIGFLLLSKLLGTLCSYNSHVLTFLPLLSGIASVYFFQRILQQLQVPKAAPLLALFFAFNPSLIYYSGEFKQYGLDVFFSVLILSTTMTFLQRRSSFVAMAITLCTSFFFSHAAFLVASSAGLAVFAHELSLPKEQRSYLHKILSLGFVALLLAGTLAFQTLNTMPGNMDGFGGGTHAFLPISSPSAAFSWLFSVSGRMLRLPTYLLYMPYLNFGPLFGVLNGIMFALALLGLWRLFRKDKFITILFSLPLLLCFLASSTRNWPIMPGDQRGRVILFFSVFIYGLFAISFHHLFRYRILQIFLSCATLGSLSLYLLASDYAQHGTIEPVLSEVQKLPSTELLLCDQYAYQALISHDIHHIQFKLMDGNNSEHSPNSFYMVSTVNNEYPCPIFESHTLVSKSPDFYLYSPPKVTAQ